MPFDRSRYPREWPQISAHIRERAGNRCEFCGAPNGAFICRDQRDPARYEVIDAATADAWGMEGAHIVLVVLTVAHIRNDDPQDCSDENLKALCQRCHLRLDAGLHARHAAETRRRHKVEAGQGVLLAEEAH